MQDKVLLGRLIDYSHFVDYFHGVVYEVCFFSDNIPPRGELFFLRGNIDFWKKKIDVIDWVLK